MKLYVMRHGETNRNKLNHVLGRSDLPLNEKGLSQADMAGRKLKDIHFDAIYSSPMKRACQTAWSVVRHQTNPAPVLVDDRLIEQNFGEFEGFSRDDERYQKEKRDYFKPFKGGESFLDVAARVYCFLDDLARESVRSDRENILITTHGGILRVIENYFSGMENEEFTRFFASNCEVRCYDFPKKDRDTLKPLDDFQLRRLESSIPKLQQEKEAEDLSKRYVSGLHIKGITNECKH